MLSQFLRHAMMHFSGQPGASPAMTLVVRLIFLGFINTFTARKLLQCKSRLNEFTSFREFKKMISKKESLNRTIKHLARNFVLPVMVMGESDSVAQNHTTPTRTAIAREGLEHVSDLELLAFHKHVLQIDPDKKIAKKRKLFELFNRDKQARMIWLSSTKAHFPLTVCDSAGEKQLNRCVHCNHTKEGQKENVRTSSWCEIGGVYLCTKKKKNKRKTCIEKWHEQHDMNP